PRSFDQLSQEGGLVERTGAELAAQLVAAVELPGFPDLLEQLRNRAAPKPRRPELRAQPVPPLGHENPGPETVRRRQAVLMVLQVFLATMPHPGAVAQDPVGLLAGI